MGYCVIHVCDSIIKAVVNVKSKKLKRERVETSEYS